MLLRAGFTAANLERYTHSTAFVVFNAKPRLRNRLATTSLQILGKTIDSQTRTLSELPCQFAFPFYDSRQQTIVRPIEFAGSLLVPTLLANELAGTLKSKTCQSDRGRWIVTLVGRRYCSLDNLRVLFRSASHQPHRLELAFVPIGKSFTSSSRDGLAAPQQRNELSAITLNSSPHFSGLSQFGDVHRPYSPNTGHSIRQPSVWTRLGESTPGGRVV
ncbi:hypothetical protein SAMN02990966_04228 [Rhodospirillales bacterium URHD0017]|nr:hypothetical protein SAMN02990966_04228 [Rhodospirillales bacterium URHD0017]